MSRMRPILDPCRYMVLVTMKLKRGVDSEKSDCLWMSRDHEDTIFRPKLLAYLQHIALLFA